MITSKMIAIETNTPHDTVLHLICDYRLILGIDRISSSDILKKDELNLTYSQAKFMLALLRPSCAEYKRITDLLKNCDESFFRKKINTLVMLANDLCRQIKNLEAICR